MARLVPGRMHLRESYLSAEEMSSSQEDELHLWDVFIKLSHSHTHSLHQSLSVSVALIFLIFSLISPSPRTSTQFLPVTLSFIPSLFLIVLLPFR